MPHHPSEENAPDNLTDKVARESTSANTSDHPMHDENKGPVEDHKAGKDKQERAQAQAFHSKGPAIPQGDLPPAKSRDELEAESKRLNG